MNYKEKINKILDRSNGIVTRKDLEKENIPSIYLTYLVKNNELIRTDKGIYINSKGDFDDYYFFSQRFRVPIFSYNSALYFHNFTELLPYNLDVTVYRGYNAHRIKDKVRVHYVSKEIYELGVTRKKTIFGNFVRTYDLDRTICDFIKNRDKIERELFSKTINRYIRSNEKDLSKLYHYSKKMNILNKVRDIVDIVYDE